MSINIKKNSGTPKKGGYDSHTEYSTFYTWRIKNIKSYLISVKSAKKDIVLESPKFTTNAPIKDLWYLQLQITQDNKSWVSIYLYSNNESQKIQTKFLLFVLNNNPNEKIVHDFQVYNQSHKSLDHIFEGSAEGYGYSQFLKRGELIDRKKEFHPKDTLRVCVNLTVFIDNLKIDDTIERLTNAGPKLLDDLKNLLITKKKSDVVIKVGDKRFDAHKLILSARSCVFDAMFSHEMKENKENEVTISGIDPEVFKNFLNYIYTDQADELDKFAEELLEASDMYQLHGLKKMCEASLIKKLALDNTVRILILADCRNANILKDSAINYVIANFIKFKPTRKFKALERSHPSLYLMILKKYSNV